MTNASAAKCNMKKREKEREKRTFPLARRKIYAILIMRTRQENAQREVIALSITLMTGAEAKMGVGWAAITIAHIYIYAYTTGLSGRRDKRATLSYSDENNVAVKFPAPYVLLIRRA